jgi:glycosyltransferase involved in cell wall biosynthesis
MGYWYSRFNLIPLRINAYYVDRVIVNSQAVKNITVLKENYFPQKVDVIYNGYSGCDHDPTPSILDERLASKFEDGDFRIVLVANIRPIKRIADAIYALEKISENIPTANLYIIGDGDSSDLQKIVEVLDVTTKVHFLGARDDVLDLLPHFDIGILCSESEGFSNTLIEYFQAGLPVVCTDVGGNAEIIDNGVNGFLYEVGDVQALAAHIITIESDGLLRSKMGMSGKDKVERHYSLTQTVEQHQQIYQEVLSSK